MGSRADRPRRCEHRAAALDKSELHWHLMRMATYAESVRVLQPIIGQLFDAIQTGLKSATEDHADRGLFRRDDQHFYVHSVRRIACDRLRADGLQVTNERGRPFNALSGLLVFYNHTLLKVLRVSEDPKKSSVTIPAPGRSKRRQDFWAQRPSPALPGMETDNLLLLWNDVEGQLVDRMILARPLGGDHKRSNTRVEWVGKLTRQMASLRAADLDELTPDQYHQQLGDQGP